MSDVVTGTGAVMEIKTVGSLVYLPFGCADSLSYTLTNEMILKTDRNASVFRKRRVRISDCSASLDGITTLQNDTTISIMYMIQQGINRTEQDIRIKFTDEGGFQKQIQGLFLVESCSITADTSSFTDFSMQLLGTGGVSIGSPSGGSGDSGIPGDVLSDWWTTTPAGTSITGVTLGHYGRSFIGQEVLGVYREGQELDPVASSPVGRQYTYDGTTISIDPTIPFNTGETIFVIWQIDES